MTLQTWRDLRLATTWWAHSTDEHGVHEGTERMLVILQIVPATLIEHLAEDLNGGLCAVLLNLRHVEIIDEDDDLLAHAGTEYTSSALLKLVVNDFLNLVAAGLSGETDLNELILGFIFSVQLVHKNVLDINGLARACGTDEERRYLVNDTELLDEAVTDSVNGCDDDLLDFSIFAEVIYLILVGVSHPIAPLVLLHVVEVVVNETSIEA